jgi:hypothetical protein
LWLMLGGDAYYLIIVTRAFGVIVCVVLITHGWRSS